MNSASPILAELSFVLLSILVFRAGQKRFGLRRTSLFFLGSILWTGPLENFAILRGAYTYYAYAGDLLPQYPGYLMWLGLLPFWIVLGWFVFAMSGFLIFHDSLLRGRRALLQAGASAIFAVNIDLMMDPVASSNGLWVWLTGAFRLFGVPLFNFIGWFMLIFFYDLIAEHTIFNSKPMLVLSGMERRLFGVKGENGNNPDLARLVFRIILLEAFVILALTTLSDLINAVAFSLA